MGLLDAGEYGAEWYLEIPRGVAEDAVHCFVGAFARVHPGALEFGVD